MNWFLGSLLLLADTLVAAPVKHILDFSSLREKDPRHPSACYFDGYNLECVNRIEHGATTPVRMSKTIDVREMALFPKVSCFLDPQGLSCEGDRALAPQSLPDEFEAGLNDAIFVERDWCIASDKKVHCFSPTWKTDKIPPLSRATHLAFVRQELWVLDEGKAVHSLNSRGESHSQRFKAPHGGLAVAGECGCTLVEGKVACGVFCEKYEQVFQDIEAERLFNAAERICAVISGADKVRCFLGPFADGPTERTMDSVEGRVVDSDLCRVRNDRVECEPLFGEGKTLTMPPSPHLHRPRLLSTHRPYQKYASAIFCVQWEEGTRCYQKSGGYFREADAIGPELEKGPLAKLGPEAILMGPESIALIRGSRLEWYGDSAYGDYGVGRFTWNPDVGRGVSQMVKEARDFTRNLYFLKNQQLFRLNLKTTQNYGEGIIEELSVEESGKKFLSYLHSSFHFGSSYSTNREPILITEKRILKLEKGKCVPFIHLPRDFTARAVVGAYETYHEYCVAESDRTTCFKRTEPVISRTFSFPFPISDVTMSEARLLFSDGKNFLGLDDWGRLRPTDLDFLPVHSAGGNLLSRREREVYTTPHRYSLGWGFNEPPIAKLMTVSDGARTIHALGSTADSLREEFYHALGEAVAGRDCFLSKFALPVLKAEMGHGTGPWQLQVALVATKLESLMTGAGSCGIDLDGAKRALGLLLGTVAPNANLLSLHQAKQWKAIEPILRKLLAGEALLPDIRQTLWANEARLRTFYSSMIEHFVLGPRLAGSSAALSYLLE